MLVKAMNKSEELSHMYTLLEKIQCEGWVDEDTIIVNVNPLYSSYLSQFMNHQFSIGGEFHDMLNLEVPQGARSQVWNSEDAEFQPYTNYLHWWVSKYIQIGTKYLFVSLRPFSHIQQIRNIVRTRTSHEFFRFATLVGTTEGFQADFKSIITNLPTVFEWENLNNGKQ